MYLPILYFYRDLNPQGSDSESSLMSTKPQKTSCIYPDFFHDTLTYSCFSPRVPLTLTTS